MSENPYRNTEASSPTPLRKRGFSWTELVIVAAIIVVIAAMVVPNSTIFCHRARESRNDLKQIGLALHYYHDVWESFPPAYTVDEDGRRLHSWRVLLLPFMEQSELYKKIDLQKSWIHPDNAEARGLCPNAFRPDNEDSVLPDGFTSYKALVGEGTVFPIDGSSTSIDQMLDGTSLTLAVVETTRDHSVHWMNPDDDGAADFLGVLSSQPTAGGAVLALFADGSTQYLGFDTKPETVAALMTYAGGEVVDNDDY